MSRKLEDYLPPVKEDGLVTDKAVTFGSTLAVTGATAFAAATTGLRITPEIIASGDDTLLAAESGKMVIATQASTTQTFTLPAATVAGCYFIFKCGSAAGEILIDPAGTDVIQAKATNDAGADITPAGGTGIKNTAASNVIGDYIALIADGVDTWRTVAQSGIFASQ